MLSEWPTPSAVVSSQLSSPVKALQQASRDTLDTYGPNAQEGVATLQPPYYKIGLVFTPQCGEVEVVKRVLMEDGCPGQFYEDILEIDTNRAKPGFWANFWQNNTLKVGTSGVNVEQKGCTIL